MRLKKSGSFLGQLWLHDLSYSYHFSHIVAFWTRHISGKLSLLGGFDLVANFRWKKLETNRKTWKPREKLKKFLWHSYCGMSFSSRSFRLAFRKHYWPKSFTLRPADFAKLPIKVSSRRRFASRIARCFKRMFARIFSQCVGLIFAELPKF